MKINSKPIDTLYLHFLNREMYHPIGCKINDEDVLNALKIITLTTDELLSTSIAYVWECFYELPCSSRFILDLLSEGMLCLIGSSYSNNEFLEKNHKLYEHDKKRYNMYYNNIPKELLEYMPKIIKFQDTTAYLEKELFVWADTGKSSVIENSEMNRHLLKQHRPIIGALTERENKAITKILFEDKLSSNIDVNQLSRNITLLHLASYIDYIDGDIVSGYRNLDFFDTISKDYPIYDLGIRAFILESIGVDLDMEPNILLAYAKASERSVFAKKLENFIERVYYTVLSKANKTISAIICHNMKELIKPSLCAIEKSEFFSWENYLACLDTINDFLCKHETAYNDVFNATNGKEITAVKKILLCTATNDETKKTLEVAKNYGLNPKIQYLDDHSVYRLGSMKGVDISVVQSEMGTEAPGGATLTVNDVSMRLCPQYAISVGICYGLEEKKAKLGDVVVASQLQLYDLRKISGDDEEVIPRGNNVSPSVDLLSRFRSSAMSYNGDSVHFERFITGNILVNSLPAAQKLKNTFKEAFAGDMEAGGIYSVCDKRKISWGIVKGISDWGHKKDDSHQDLARTNAISFVFYSIAQGGFV